MEALYQLSYSPGARARYQFTGTDRTPGAEAADAELHPDAHLPRSARDRARRAGGLLDVGGNIVENAQFGDTDTNTFCMRTVFDSDVDDEAAVAAAVTERLGDASATIRVPPRPPAAVMIMVSR